MAKYTHREIEEAKMLARNFSRNENVPVPPLTRFVSAARFFFAAMRTALRMRLAAAWRYIRDVTVCPRCDGRHDMIEFHELFGPDPGHDDNLPGTKCRLCKGTGEVRWRYVESFKWGKALMRYRLHSRISLSQAFYLCGMTPQQIERYECGLVPLDDWPETLRNLADLQLDREAAGHVSTT